MKKLLRLILRVYIIRRVFIVGYNLFYTNEKQVCLNSDSLELEIEEFLQEINRVGFSSVFKLRVDKLEALLEDCRTNQCVADGHPDLDYTIDLENPVNPNLSHIRYIYKDYMQWESVKNIIHNSDVLKIAKTYLGNEPIIQNVSLWWSFPKDENVKSNIYNFHYDIDNFKFIKLFTYLTDVDENNGPHMIYPSSHKRKTLSQMRYRSIPNDKIDSVMKNKQPVKMLGTKGTSFFEDTFSYHKGLNPIKPRLIFQVEYSLTKNKLG